MSGKLLHAGITKRVIGAGMDVFNSVGPGWDEWDYHRSMLNALADRGLKAESHLRGFLMHRGECVDRFELDILVEDKVVLELKHLREGFAPEHYVQLINYLKFWQKDLGLLMNFGGDRLYFKRVPYSPRPGVVETGGEWSFLQAGYSESAGVVREASFRILSEHGLGYSRSTSEKLLVCELKHLGANPRPASVRLSYGDLQLGERTVDSFIIDPGFVFRVTALPEGTGSADLTRLQSHMRQLGISGGLVVNFGRSVLFLRAVRVGGRVA